VIRLTYRMDLYGLKHPPLLPVAKRGDKSAFIILSVRDDQTLPGEFLAEGAKGFVASERRSTTWLQL